MSTDELVERLRIRMTIVQELDCVEWVPDPLCQEAADTIATLTAQLAEARASERAAVVAWVRAQCKAGEDMGFTAQARAISSFATAIEQGGHLT
ncbi:hypothetical protein AQZ52_10835 [Novosphingobium fuchskuhlense]|uniref:Uncharacterized protein n=1 Tax=Novosphingobium fuchskuhlense TaxID=1117702 RepID=A0A117UUM4_9SPHN|nr:hypothetical protein [Novosphingobium fuchskuhlense]KUR71159.1 hypothetical protein AQZ52_10835 [Novosphingobium fuchskuhlense]